MAEVSNSNLLKTATGAADGSIAAEGACIVIVRTEWNAAIVGALEEGCRSALERAGACSYKVVTVPGAFEIPFGIQIGRAHV